MKRAIATILVVICILTTGCQNTATVVMSYGDSVITENEFRYYISYYKNVYLTTYNDMTDTDAFYTKMLSNGMTAEEYLFNMTVENVQMALIAMELFDSLELTLDTGVVSEIEAYIQDLIDEYAGGDKKALNQELAQYGINISLLKEIYIAQEKNAFLYDYLFGDEGVQTITETQKANYYKENYIRIRHIYVNDAYYYPLDADGYRQYDSEGYPITEELTPELAAEKAALIDTIDASLAAGMDFEEVYEAYSEEHYYENGYYLTRTTDFIPELISAAFALSEGEQQKLKTDYGTHYIMRLPLDDGAYYDNRNADFFNTFDAELKYELFLAYLRAHFSEVYLNNEIISGYSIKESPVIYRF